MVTGTDIKAAVYKLAVGSAAQFAPPIDRISDFEPTVKQTHLRHSQAHYVWSSARNVLGQRRTVI